MKSKKKKAEAVVVAKRAAPAKKQVESQRKSTTRKLTPKTNPSNNLSKSAARFFCREDLKQANEGPANANEEEKSIKHDKIEEAKEAKKKEKKKKVIENTPLDPSTFKTKFKGFDTFDYAEIEKANQDFFETGYSNYIKDVKKVCFSSKNSIGRKIA